MRLKPVNLFNGVIEVAIKFVNVFLKRDHGYVK